jgi:GDPmannose 4,6-dehydratase
MLQQDSPEDFVLATGKMYTIREFAEKSAPYVGFDIEWKGEGVNEKGIDKKTGKIIIEVDPRYFRPTEVDLLVGNPAKAKEKLGWQTKVDIDQLAKIMMESDKKDAGL